MIDDVFFRLVSDMRQAQKDYFSSRNKAALAKAKALERQVDFVIETLNNHQRYLGVDP